MINRGHIALAVLVVAASLVGGLVVVIRAQSLDDPAFSGPLESPASSPSATAADQSSGATRNASPGVAPAPTTTLPTPAVKVPGPPADTVHLHDRYRVRYQGTYATWDQLLADGKELPAVSKACRSAWRAATRDDALNWDKASYLCLDRFTRDGFKPQGIGGSGSTEGYRIGDRAAAERNIVIVSSYSSKKETGLLFPHKPGETDTTRLTVIDVGRGRYNTIELVKPAGASSFTALDSHGSGFAWVGQYLYSSSRTALWMYNADDLMRIDGHYVLPAVTRWSVHGPGGGLSSLGIDRSAKRSRLISINYTETGTAWSQSFQLDRTGLLQRGSAAATHGLNLTRSYGAGPAAVRSTRSTAVQGTNFQGIGTSGTYRFVNSSSLMLDGKRHGDNLVILKKHKPIARFAMPSENVESLYVDYRRSRYVTITEHGRQFLFWLPLDHLIARAER